MGILACLATTLIALLVASNALAESELSRDEKEFLLEASQESVADVQLSQLAQKNASSPQVKQFAERLMEDHSRVERQLQQIAAAHNISIPADIPEGKEQHINTLEKLSGPDFDQAFTRHMLLDHQDDVREFREMASQAKSREIKQFASNTLPTLEQHLSTAQKLNQRGQ